MQENTLKPDKEELNINKYYCVINANDKLITIHPNIPRNKYIRKTLDSGKILKFTMSKKYGTFWIYNNSSAIYQLSLNDYNTIHCVIRLKNNTYNHSTLKQKHTQLFCYKNDYFHSISEFNSIKQC